MNIHYLHHILRNGYRALALGALLALGLAGCSSDELLPVAPEAGGNTDPDAQPRITITADMGVGASTRTGHDDVTDEGVKVNWAEGDAFIIYSIDAAGKKVGESVFTLVAGEAGKASAAFEGTKPVEGAKYAICYPAEVEFEDSYGMGYLASLDMRRQKQTGNNSTAHLSKFDPMRGHPVTEGDFSKISFTPDDTTHKESGHRATLMRLDLTNIPTDLGTPERIVVGRLGTNSNYGFQYTVVVAGTYISGGSEPATSTLELEKVTAAGQSITAYMMMNPLPMLAGSQLTITLEGSQKSYTFTSPVFGEGGKEFERGMRYVASADTWTEAVITYDGKASAGYYYTGGEGTAASPYLISTAEDLELLIGEGKAGNTTGKYYKLTRNINIPSGTAWMPIGIDTGSKSFKGHFDGGGRTISGEMKSSNTELGFFGCVQDATITNLHVSATVTNAVSGGYTGAIAAYAKSSTISYCTNAGAVSGYLPGGIVGKIDECTLINCTNTGSVATTSSSVGGITGHSTSSAIIGCANTGEITAPSMPEIGGGGIAGVFTATDGTQGKIYGCYNTGLIKRTYNTGAIIGIVGSTGTLVIESCRYVLASGQAGNLVACSNKDDNTLTDVAKCDNVAALNIEAVLDALNAGITKWNSTATEGLPTCYPFKSGGSAVPAIALPVSNGGIGNITDGGNALQ